MCEGREKIKKIEDVSFKNLLKILKVRVIKGESLIFLFLPFKKNLFFGVDSAGVNVLSYTC